VRALLAVAVVVLGIVAVLWGAIRCGPAATGPTTPAARPPAPAASSPTPTPTPTPATPTGLTDEPRNLEVVETGIAECDAFIRRYLACGEIATEAKEAIGASFRDWRTQATGGSADVVARLTQACRDTIAVQGPTLDQIGC
jgi:hypothetical protein